MSAADMPPLPEPEGWRIFDGEGGYNYSDESPDEFRRAWAGRYQRKHEPLFTAEQMHTYARTHAAAVAAPLVEALERADRFITNGIALGFIRMPDKDVPDTAHETPGIVRAALAAFKEKA